MGRKCALGRGQGKISQGVDIMMWATGEVPKALPLCWDPKDEWDLSKGQAKEGKEQYFRSEQESRNKILERQMYSTCPDTED